MGRPGEEGFDWDEYNAIASFPGLFVCISGNHEADIDTVPYYPASYNLPNIIVVGGSNIQDKKYSLSSVGSNSVDLFAPAFEVRTLSNAGSYVDSSGTSFAAPIVTGVVALMIAKYPDQDRYWIKNKLLESVTKVDLFSDKCVSGGRLNAYRALCPHDNPEEYDSYSTEEHFITCECGYEGYMPHVYDHSIGAQVGSQHYVYCACGASTLENHIYTEVYYNASQHKVVCECGAFTYSSHSYIKRYTSINDNQHTAYCACGDSITENHTRATDMDLGISYCTKCDYRLELWNIKDEHELQ
jgi:hypothetical protein